MKAVAHWRTLSECDDLVVGIKNQCKNQSPMLVQKSKESSVLCKRRILIIPYLLFCGCNSNQFTNNASIADKNSAIIAVLVEEARKSEDDQSQLCIMKNVKKSPYVEYNSSSTSIIINRFPTKIKACGKDFGSYIQVYEPDIFRDKATVYMDFYGSGAGAAGLTFILERSKKGWSVTDQTARWLF